MGEHDDGKGSGVGKRVLTSVDQPIVVLLERLGSVALARKGNLGDALGPSIGVVVDGDGPQGTNGRCEQFLQRIN